MIKKCAIKPGDLIFVSPSGKAQGRTKNRLREHGAAGFIIRQISENVGCMGNRPAILLKSISSTSLGNKEWSGWLATEEIEVINESR